MNSTIQQLQANQKFEKLLNLFEEIAPDNQNVQKQISLLSNSKGNYIKKLQSMWHAIQPQNLRNSKSEKSVKGTTWI